VKHVRLRERVLTAVLLIAALGFLTLQTMTSFGSGDPVATADPWPRPAAAQERALGLTTLALARNVHTPFDAADLGEVNTTERAVRAHAGVVMFFADWAGPLPTVAQLRAIGGRGAVPEVTWEPWDAVSPLGGRQPGYRLGRIAAGVHDDLIRRFARRLAAYGGPVRLRFAHEMNAGTYPWSAGRNGNRDREFVRAWRHVHRLMREEGADEVRFVWSPRADAAFEPFWPGRRYVDVIGLSGFNGGDELDWSGWRNPEAIFVPNLRAVRRLAPGIEMELSEVAAAEGGGSKARWIEQLFGMPDRQFPEVRTVVWFDLDKEARWSIASSPASTAAFGSALELWQGGARDRADSADCEPLAFPPVPC
jgi:mannan endo-1,4-beta-mannosidase